jgi:hyperosmotically inducible periplasmic protein
LAWNPSKFAEIGATFSVFPISKNRTWSIDLRKIRLPARSIMSFRMLVRNWISALSQMPEQHRRPTTDAFFHVVMVMKGFLFSVTFCTIPCLYDQMEGWRTGPCTGNRQLKSGSSEADPDGRIPRVRRSENMIWTMRIPRAALFAATLSSAFFSLPQAALAAQAGSAASAQTENPAVSAAAARLNKAQYRNVKVSVDHGIATLTGFVNLYEYKADAEKRVRKAAGVTAVRNLIEVEGPSLSDKDLQAKLAEDLAYDRVGWGDAAFNAITVGVDHGVVTLGGHARTDVDKDSALALVATTHGVKDVVDEIEVDPVSIMDNEIRRNVARAIYGYSFLSKYAVDPVRPIRISVQNGHVELYGVVDSQADKDVAFIRANGVSGVFSVKNYLRIAGQPVETRK